jgi:hypothetical protein
VIPLIRVRFPYDSPNYARFVYRLGRWPFTPERGVRFPYRVPLININMVIATPLDIPPLVPDDWEVFWDIWNTNSDNLVKTHFIPQDPGNRPAYNNSQLGRNDIWIGMDIYQTRFAEKRTLWQSPYIDISQKLPKMHQQCLDLPFLNINCVRIVKSLINFKPHSDDGLNTWRIRSMFHHPWKEQQWSFSLPEGNKLLPLNLPEETNWFSYNDKHCWHATAYNPDKEKLLVIVDGFVPPALLIKSQEKYKNFVLTEDSFK